MITSLQAGLGGAAALLGGDILNYVGQTNANQANRDIANQATQTNVLEAERNRQFQAEQSATAHQRQVADLKKAGLNPLLSANSGASTPTGAQGQAQTASVQNPFAGNRLSGLVTSALQAATMVGGIAKQEAETDLIKKQTGKTSHETEGIIADTERKKFMSRGYRLGNEFLNSVENAFKSSAKAKPVEIKNPFTGKKATKYRKFYQQDIELPKYNPAFP